MVIHRMAIHRMAIHRMAIHRMAIHPMATHPSACSRNIGEAFAAQPMRWSGTQPAGAEPGMVLGFPPSVVGSPAE
jgi:hypothetical protein